MKNNLNHSFLLILISIVFVASYFVFKPFLISVFLAFVLYTLFKGIYEKLVIKISGRRSIASVLMCLLVIILIVLPFFLTISLAVKETVGIIQEIQQKNISIDLGPIANFPLVGGYLSNLSDIDLNNLSQSPQLTSGAKGVGTFLFSVLRTVYESTSNFIFMLVVMFFSLYYLFKDGNKFINKLMCLSPLSNKQEKLLIEKFDSITKATIKGTLVIAIIQGLLIGLIFSIAGVFAPVLWGMFTVIVSIIPLLGAVIVWLPVAVGLFLFGNIWQAIFVAAFGAIVISSVDNFLRPKLVEGQTSLHPLLVFLSTLGGIAMFGPIGFIIGPVIIALLLVLLEIYQREFNQKLENFKN